MHKFTLALFTVLLASACGKSESADPAPAAGKPAPAAAKPAPSTTTVAPPTPVAADPVAKAKEIFKIQCAVCHGEDGKGTGVAAASLDPKPRDYTDKTWQTSVDDAKIKKVILEGGAANGLSAAMAPYAAVFKDDPAALDEVVKIIRGFGG